MTKIISNKLCADVLDIQSIEASYDIYEVSRDGSEGWVNASVLSLDNEVLKAESVVYSGEGNVFYMMFRKNTTSREMIVSEFSRAGHSDYNPRLVRRLAASPLSNDRKHLLVQLFLNSLGNSRMPSRKYNNVIGRLYYSTPQFGKGNKVWFLDISVDSELNLNASVVTYTKVIVSDEIRKNTWYVFDKGKGLLRRISRKEAESEGVKEVYIRRSIGKKTIVPFMEYDSRQHLENSKVGAFASIIRQADALKPYITLSFIEKDVMDSSVMLANQGMFTSRIDSVAMQYDEKNTVIANAFKRELARNNVKTLEGQALQDTPILCFVEHGKDYYITNHINDPYENVGGTYTQHIDCDRFCDNGTVPEILDDKALELVEVMSSAILSELRIKRDIHTGIVTTVDLQDFGYFEKMTFMKCFTQEKRENVYVFLDLEPSGRFTFRIIDFNDPDINVCDDDLDVIAEYEGQKNRSEIDLVFYKELGNIYLIRQTGERTMPQSLSVWDDISKIRPEERFNGEEVRDWFSEFSDLHVAERCDAGYNRQLEVIRARIAALGQQVTSKDLHTAICLQTKAGKDFNKFLQEIKDIWVFHNIKREEVDDTYRMSSFLGVKYWPTQEKEGTYSYVVGLINRWNSFKFYKIDKGSVIRRIEGIGCVPPSDLVEMIVSMTKVDFVRQGGYTVFPFINKYIEEIYRRDHRRLQESAVFKKNI